MTYSEVEAALAQLYSAESVRETGFRARIRHFQRLGIPLGVAPGKGKRIDYTREHVLQWALCLEFAELGVDPYQVAELLKERWQDKLAPALTKRYDRDNNVFLVLRPTFMSKTWRASEPMEIVQTDEKRIHHVLGDHAGLDRRRASVINLSALSRLLSNVGIFAED